nr:hypothetical protein [uncultured Rhodopila sp.]
MEGGSPALIWERWTLPMYYAQQRYWGDHPRPNALLRMLVATKYKIPTPKKTPPPGTKSAEAPAVDLSALDAPLTPAELGKTKPLERLR